MAAVGMHCLLEIYGCPAEKLDDPAFVREALREAATYAGATWLGGCDHHFKPCGVTAVGMLAESHISLHSWPEIGYAAIDVFTCGDVAMPEKACEKLIELFEAERHTLTRIPRATELLAREVRGVDVREAHMSERAAISHEVLRGKPAEMAQSVGD